MTGNNRILVVDDEASVNGAMQAILSDRGFHVSTASTVHEAAQLMKRAPFSLVFTDYKLPDASGFDLLDSVKQQTPLTEVIMMTAYGSLDVTIQAIKKGAYYYVEKPFTPAQVVDLAEAALRQASANRERHRALDPSGADFLAAGIIGRNPKMIQIYSAILAAAPSDAAVLIEGESGTGKELIATAFHLKSHRAQQPFIRINCAAIPHDLIESELFGYKRGAFTGAERDKRGLFEAASGGTLLLDEIAEMPPHLQTKLLRVLQEKKLRRIGDETVRGADFRLISATNRNTEQARKEGFLREDLYFRISTIRIQVPPLRDRLDDLALLAQHLLRCYGEKYQKRIRKIAPEAMNLLTRYRWPGNVRELESVIERAVLFCQSRLLLAEDLPEVVRAPGEQQSGCEIPAYMSLEEIEREAFAQTLHRTGGNVKKTAEILKLHRPTLYRKLKRYGLLSQRHPE